MMFNVPVKLIDQVIKANKEDFKEFPDKKPVSIVTISQRNKFEIIELDDDGKLLIYTKIFPNGNRYRYDSHDNLIYVYIQKFEYEEWSKYDKNRNCIHMKTSMGLEKEDEISNYRISLEIEKIIKQDNDEVISYFENDSNDVDWRVYSHNSLNDLIHYVDSTGMEARYIYDDSGNILRYKNNKGSDILINGNKLIDLKIENMSEVN